MSNERNAKPLPSTFIDTALVNERVTNFINNKHPLLSTAIGKPESKSAWYSIDQFEELVRELHYQNADGLRIYFGAYGETDLLYPNQLTIIFVPTCLDEISGKHKDIIIDNDDNFCDRSNASQKSTTTGTRKGLDSIGLCPPSCEPQDPSYPY